MPPICIISSVFAHRSLLSSAKFTIDLFFRHTLYPQPTHDSDPRQGSLDLCCTCDIFHTAVVARMLLSRQRNQHGRQINFSFSRGQKVWTVIRSFVESMQLSKTQHFESNHFHSPCRQGTFRRPNICLSFQ